MTFSRPSGRAADQLRTVSIERHFTRHAEGSVLVSYGDTRVLCTASIEERVPPWLRGKGEGWVTAEYGMLPRATSDRTQREAARGGQGGRTMEIQRLIGRSLRACVDRGALGERVITLDCDVLQADGGTRTAAITGAYVALVDAVATLTRRNAIKRNPIMGAVAAVSVGIYQGVPVLDLDYAEDSNCDTDMNVVMNDGGGLIEVQGTAEGHAFRREEMNAMLDLAAKGVTELVAAQRAALEATPISLVAVDDDDTVIGHVLFSPVTVENGDDGKSLGLAPVAVHPDHQRQGIGRDLIEEGIGACFVADARAVFVLGSPAYYNGFGFIKASAHGLHDAFEGGNAFQVLPLTVEGLAGYGGRVDYASEFAEGL
ncbi:hypothetical protein KCV01_g9928, partial [Aureobasidium melanogenum]